MVSGVCDSRVWTLVGCWIRHSNFVPLLLVDVREVFLLVYWVSFYEPYSLLRFNYIYNDILLILRGLVWGATQFFLQKKSTVTSYFSGSLQIPTRVSFFLFLRCFDTVFRRLYWYSLKSEPVIEYDFFQVFKWIWYHYDNNKGNEE